MTAPKDSSSDALETLLSAFTMMIPPGVFAPSSIYGIPIIEIPDMPNDKILLSQLRTNDQVRDAARMRIGQLINQAQANGEAIQRMQQQEPPKYETAPDPDAWAPKQQPGSFCGTPPQPPALYSLIDAIKGKEPLSQAPDPDEASENRTRVRRGLVPLTSSQFAERRRARAAGEARWAPVTDLMGGVVAGTPVGPSSSGGSSLNKLRASFGLDPVSEQDMMDVAAERLLAMPHVQTMLQDAIKHSLDIALDDDSAHGCAQSAPEMTVVAISNGPQPELRATIDPDKYFAAYSAASVHPAPPSVQDRTVSRSTTADLLRRFPVSIQGNRDIREHLECQDALIESLRGEVELVRAANDRVGKANETQSREISRLGIIYRNEVDLKDQANRRAANSQAVAQENIDHVRRLKLDLEKATSTNFQRVEIDRLKRDASALQTKLAISEEVASGRLTLLNACKPFTTEIDELNGKLATAQKDNAELLEVNRGLDQRRSFTQGPSLIETNAVNAQAKTIAGFTAQLARFGQRNEEMHKLLETVDPGSGALLIERVRTVTDRLTMTLRTIDSNNRTIDRLQTENRDLRQTAGLGSGQPTVSLRQVVVALDEYGYAVSQDALSRVNELINEHRSLVSKVSEYEKQVRDPENRSKNQLWDIIIAANLVLDNHQIPEGKLAERIRAACDLLYRTRPLESDLHRWLDELGIVGAGTLKQRIRAIYTAGRQDGDRAERMQQRIIKIGTLLTEAGVNGGIPFDRVKELIKQRDDARARVHELVAERDSLQFMVSTVEQDGAFRAMRKLLDLHGVPAKTFTFDRVKALIDQRDAALVQDGSRVDASHAAWLNRQLDDIGLALNNGKIHSGITGTAARVGMLIKDFVSSQQHMLKIQKCLTETSIRESQYALDNRNLVRKMAAADLALTAERLIAQKSIAMMTLADHRVWEARRDEYMALAGLKRHEDLLDDIRRVVYRPIAVAAYTASIKEQVQNAMDVAVATYDRMNPQPKVS